MTESAGRPTPTKSASAILVLFLPSVTRAGEPVDQAYWVNHALQFLGTCFGGATAYPKGRGVWRDDERGGLLVFDDTVAIHCYTSPQLLKANYDVVVDFLVELGQRTRQGAVGFVVGEYYMEIPFPLEGQVPP